MPREIVQCVKVSGPEFGSPELRGTSSVSVTLELIRTDRQISRANCLDSQSNLRVPGSARDTVSKNISSSWVWWYTH